MNEYDNDEEFDDEVEYYAVRPNKTQIKKDIATLFELGETMSELSPAHLDSLELPDNIHQAIMVVAGLPRSGARKRSLKYIASILHKIDLTPIQEKLARIQSRSAHAVREHHILERWRDRLISEGNEALTALVDEQPATDLQKIRQMLRNIKKETDSGGPPKSSRLLYQYLKTLFQFEGDTGRENEEA